MKRRIIHAVVVFAAALFVAVLILDVFCAAAYNAGRNDGIAHVFNDSTFFLVDLVEPGQDYVPVYVRLDGYTEYELAFIG